jgi:AcrR family transcriptional regulator
VANTQITDIVRIARVSRRTFHACFADKQSALVELIRAAQARLVAYMLVGGISEAVHRAAMDGREPAELRRR